MPQLKPRQAHLRSAKVRRGREAAQKLLLKRFHPLNRSSGQKLHPTLINRPNNNKSPRRKRLLQHTPSLPKNNRTVLTLRHHQDIIHSALLRLALRNIPPPRQTSQKVSHLRKTRTNHQIPRLSYRTARNHHRTVRRSHHRQQQPRHLRTRRTHPQRVRSQT